VDGHPVFSFHGWQVGKKRETGNVGVTDMLMIVLIADAAQNGMASD
jgi:hypothetical protein